jgi:hypothetical protein
MVLLTAAPPDEPTTDGDEVTEPTEESAATAAEQAPRVLTRRRLLAGVLALVGAIIGVVLVSRARLAQRHQRLADDLIADAEPPTDEPFGHDHLTDLPAPVQRYFETVLTEGQPYVETARIRQDGQLRMGEDDGSWKPMTATQTVSVTPPGFVWDAQVEMAPLLPVSVVDSYSDGEGTLRAKLLSLVTVADDGPSPEMDEGELSRYLAEAPWYPTALLPESGVEWEPVGDTAARATLTDDDTTVSMVFRFDDEHRIERVVAEDRPMATDDGYERATWTGQFRDYERRDGMLVPTAGEVAWNLPEGDRTYWRATMTAFDYRFAGDGADASSG